MREQIAIIGFGYVGLPLFLVLAKKFPGSIGFDININKVQLLQQGIEPSGELSFADFNKAVLKITSVLTDLARANFFVVTPPTPIDQSHSPDLTPLINASQIIGKFLQSGSVVVAAKEHYLLDSLNRQNLLPKSLIALTLEVWG